MVQVGVRMAHLPLVLELQSLEPLISSSELNLTGKQFSLFKLLQEKFFWQWLLNLTGKQPLPEKLLVFAANYSFRFLIFN